MSEKVSGEVSGGVRPEFDNPRQQRLAEIADHIRELMVKIEAAQEDLYRLNMPFQVCDPIGQLARDATMSGWSLAAHYEWLSRDPRVK